MKIDLLAIQNDSTLKSGRLFGFAVREIVEAWATDNLTFEQVSETERFKRMESRATAAYELCYDTLVNEHGVPEWFPLELLDQVMFFGMTWEDFGIMLSAWLDG